MCGMKLSISLPEEDVRFLDEYARRHDRSRSASVHQAIAALRSSTLPDAYEAAWKEWDAEDLSRLWEEGSGDGL